MQRPAGMNLRATSEWRVHVHLQATAHDAFRALVNLSDNSLLINTLSEPTFLKFVVSYILVSAFVACTLKY